MLKVETHLRPVQDRPNPKFNWFHETVKCKCNITFVWSFLTSYWSNITYVWIYGWYYFYCILIFFIKNTQYYLLHNSFSKRVKSTMWSPQFWIFYILVPAGRGPRRIGTILPGKAYIIIPFMTIWQGLRQSMVYV